MDERPRGWFSETGTEERPREVAISGGDNKDELEEGIGGVTGLTIEWGELPRGTATEGEGGGIDGAGVHSAGEGVLDFDLDRDLDLDRPSSPPAPLTTTSGGPLLRPPTTLDAPPCAYLITPPGPSLPASSVLTLRLGRLFSEKPRFPMSGPPK